MVASEYQLLDYDAFNRLVAEKDLLTWETGGYIHCKVRGKNGIEIYRTYGPKFRFLYQARRIATQANGAGGAVIVDVSLATGIEAEIIHASMANSGTNAAYMNRTDEDNNVAGYYIQVGSAAGTVAAIPRGYASPTTSNLLTAADNGRILFGPGEKFTYMQTGAGAQNDTVTCHLVMLLPVNATLSSITWSVARSTNAGNVTLAASTISEANTWQAVLLP